MSTNLVSILLGRERSVAWLARKCGCSRAYVHQIIRGERPASARFRQRAAAVLELPEEAIFPAGDGRTADTFCVAAS